MFPIILKSVSSIISYSYLIIEFLIKSISFWIKSSQFNSIKFVRFGAKFDLEIGLRCVRNRHLYMKQLMKSKQKLHWPQEKFHDLVITLNNDWIELLHCVVHWNRLSCFSSEPCLGVIRLPETYLSELDPHLLFCLVHLVFALINCFLLY